MTKREWRQLRDKQLEALVSRMTMEHVREILADELAETICVQGAMGLCPLAQVAKHILRVELKGGYLVQQDEPALVPNEIRVGDMRMTHQDTGVEYGSLGWLTGTNLMKHHVRFVIRFDDWGSDGTGSRSFYGKEVAADDSLWIA